MSTEDTSAIRAVEVQISQLMPTALDMIADVVDQPAMELADYEAITAVVETQSPLLFLALLRCAAGMAAVAGMTGDQTRALAPSDGA